ncbi:MAG TPA: vitamin K epoxide reductase family protein [Acidimicrobiales bacterium]
MSPYPDRRDAAPRWARATSFALSLAAVGIASYLTVTHYSDPTALACPERGVGNCTLVTTSSWSVFLGVPVAVWGLAWSLVMAGLTSPWAWRARWGRLDQVRVVASGLGAATVLYLVYVELFRIGAICLWCTGVHVVTVCLFGVVLAGQAAARREAAVLA